MVSAPTMTRDLRYKVLFESLVTSIAGRLARERLLTTLNVLGLMWRRESLCYVKHLRFNAAIRSRRNSYHYTYGKRLRFKRTGVEHGPSDWEVKENIQPLDLQYQE